MNIDVKDKIAVVTGGSKGIGVATARALAAHGARVVVGSRGGSRDLDALRREYDVTAVEVDLAGPDGPGALIDAAVARHGGADILVNNVGASEPTPSTSDIGDEQWQRIFDITFFAAVRAVRAAAPVMLAGGGGAIVNISSLNARMPIAWIAPYSAAKAALTNYGKALSEELAPRGVRVNTVSPGPVRTPMWTAPGEFADLMAEQAGITAQDVMDRMLPETMSITTGRVSEPEEVADLVLFLVSGRAANITGADYVIDGGMQKNI